MVLVSGAEESGTGWTEVRAPRSARLALALRSDPVMVVSSTSFLNCSATVMY